MWQVILSPRWILWHLVTLLMVITCGGLAVWQWQRAGSAMGSALNVGYGLQWPVFAVFFAVMWWRFLRAEIAERCGDPTRSDRHGADRPGAELTRAELNGAELAGAEPNGAELNGTTSVPATTATPSGAIPPSATITPTRSESRTPAPDGPSSAAAAGRTQRTPDEPSPFGPRPASARPAAVDDDPELAAYNRMLAELAARHREE